MCVRLLLRKDEGRKRFWYIIKTHPCEQECAFWQNTVWGGGGGRSLSWVERYFHLQLHSHRGSRSLLHVDLEFWDCAKAFTAAIIRTLLPMGGISWFGHGTSGVKERDSDLKWKSVFPCKVAGGHVRASAGALAVHTALIPCVCVCVCLSVCPVSNSFLITPRIGTKFVSVDR